MYFYKHKKSMATGDERVTSITTTEGSAISPTFSQEMIISPIEY
jgi:hypothetical protein